MRSPHPAEGMNGSLRHLVKPILEKISVATRTWTASLKPTNSSLVPTSLKTWYPRSLLLTPAPLSGFRFVGYNLPLTSSTGQGDLRCPPNEQCPNCHRLVADWHVEWYKTEGPSLYQGLAALDCPLCRQPVGFQGGKIGPAPPGMPLITRQADQAAEWAASQAISAGGTLQAYTSVAGAQYAAYWTPQEVLQADAHRRAKQGGP